MLRFAQHDSLRPTCFTYLRNATLADSCRLLLRQAMERAEAQHQINGMDADYDTILE